MYKFFVFLGFTIIITNSARNDNKFWWKYILNLNFFRNYEEKYIFYLKIPIHLAELKKVR